jgi:hypothetical protein
VVRINERIASGQKTAAKKVGDQVTQQRWKRLDGRTTFNAVGMLRKCRD